MVNIFKKDDSLLYDPDPLGDFRILHISILSALIGVIAGFTAFGLYMLIGIISNLVFYQTFSVKLSSLQFHSLGIWILLVPALGGLIVGLMAKFGTSKIRGHGIPEAMEAVLVNKSKIGFRVAVLKPISAAIAIGTGGPFGAEGPIIQTGGALGSLIGQVIRVTAAERKVLLACGAAAGMAATFSTPIAAVILAIELLLFEFKSRSFIPLVIASTLATAVHIWLMGPGPMFTVNAVNFNITSNLLYYVAIGIICGFAAVGFSKALYWVEDQFERLPIDPMWWPAIGGLGLGLIGLFFPRVLGVGYDTISDILNSRLSLSILIGVMILKSLALLISLGSGTSGGLLAPMFMAGSALGAVFAIVVNTLIPSAHLSVSAFALVGMAAVFAAASRATFTFIIFAFEITRDYNSILPLMLGCVIADGIGLVFMKNSIMTEKLARRGLSIHHDYEVDILRQVTVSEVMAKNPITTLCTMNIGELADKMAQGDLVYSHYTAFPVENESGELAGIITRGDILKAIRDDPEMDKKVEDFMSTQLIVAYPDESVHSAAMRMIGSNIGRLPVVDRNNPKQLVGYFGRSSVLAARLSRIQEEHVREAGRFNYRFKDRKKIKPVVH
ncbi:MAG: chloride channel protein [Ignavibacteriales bacterium]